MNLNNELKNYQEKYKLILIKALKEIQESKNIEEIFENLYTKKASIIEKKQAYECCECASCCRLAISEFSYDELFNKSIFGDNFAKQFVKTFIPYENVEDAKKIFPEYFKLLDEENTVYYCYHCPKVTEDNRCSDYANRPQICRDFPDNPIGFLPLKCSFNGWKNEVAETALEIKAMYEILESAKAQS